MILYTMSKLALPAATGISFAATIIRYMQIDSGDNVLNYGILGVLIVVIGYLLKFVSDERKRHDDNYKTIIGNYEKLTEKHTTTLAELIDVTKTVAKAVDVSGRLEAIERKLDTGGNAQNANAHN